MAFLIAFVIYILKYNPLIICELFMPHLYPLKHWIAKPSRQHLKRMLLLNEIQK